MILGPPGAQGPPCAEEPLDAEGPSVAQGPPCPEEPLDAEGPHWQEGPWGSLIMVSLCVMSL